ncbi:MAG TPA: Gfo/Idh/MocA family oxidoreductase [Verrucomicrobiota bacterium]|nr:Gfo/Idh/MocA family oxidoreductase [Verrucomicrobiota bacterium]
MKPPTPAPAPTRRGFLKRSSLLTAGALAAPYVKIAPRAFAVNDGTLKVGLVGCGGRGTGAASQSLGTENNIVLHAMGDVFEDRLKGSLEALKKEHSERVMVTPDTSFIGFDAVDKVIASGVDIVILTTPPGFRPYHIRKCIEAGKHVFSEKPMATDAPGVRMVLEAAARAKEKKLALVAGFCWRYNGAERQIMQRIHDGQIGEPMALQNTYNTGSLWVNPRRPEWNDMTYQLRNWYYYTWLSGDHIVEQAVHSIDKMQWAMKDAIPVKCVAHGGRQVRTAPEFGHIFDHFSVVYEYETGARGYHYCRQQAGAAVDNSDYFIGTKGVAIIKAFGPLVITGENPWRLRSREGVANMYQVEHDEMVASIRRGRPINDGEWMARSTMVGIMGRMAGYTGKEITWEQALNSEEDLARWVTNQEAVPGDPRFDWNLPLRVPPVAMPGQTPFV